MAEVAKCATDNGPKSHHVSNILFLRAVEFHEEYQVQWHAEQPEASVFKQHALHASFEQRLCTGGNLAFAFTPSEWEAGISYRFTLYHVLHGVSPDELFVHEVHDWQAHEPARATA